MSYIINILKGMVIGVSNIVPGVSGGTMAIIVGLYDKLIDAISEIFAHPIKVIKEMWIYVVGVVLGLCVGVIAISYLLSNYECPTTFLFIGLIVGAIPFMCKSVDTSKITKKDVIVFVLMIALIVALPFLSKLGLNTNTTNFIVLFLIGALAAATMIIPGISGSMVLMTLGFYDNIVSLVSTTLKALISFEIGAFFKGAIVILPFAIGVIVGIVLVAKLIKILMKKYKNTINMAVLGLVCASPFSVILNIDFNISIGTIIASVLMFIFGAYIASLFEKIDKTDKKERVEKVHEKIKNSAINR